MNIIEIYKKYHLPENLEMHMLKGKFVLIVTKELHQMA